MSSSRKGIPHRKWSKEDKLKYVKMHLDEHISIKEIDRMYGVDYRLVSAWTKRYLEDGEDALESRNGNPYAVERLRLIVAKQEVEIARLKKGYWVKGVGVNKEYVIGNGKTMKSSKNSK